MSTQKIARHILTYPEKEERKIEGYEKFIKGIRKGLPVASFVPISESESIIPFIDRIRNEGGRISRNYASAERQSKATRRNDSVHLGKQTKSTRNKQVPDTNDGTSKFRITYHCSGAEFYFFFCFISRFFISRLMKGVPQPILSRFCFI
jgi:hypothetical protein